MLQIDDTFIAYYQMSYGFNDTTEKVSEKIEDKSATETVNGDNTAQNINVDANQKRKTNTEPPSILDFLFKIYHQKRR